MLSNCNRDVRREVLLPENSDVDVRGLGESWCLLGKLYSEKTPSLVKAMDAYLLYVVATGILQLVYEIAVLRGRFYQYFVTGFFSSLGAFALAGKPFPTCCAPHVSLSRMIGTIKFSCVYTTMWPIKLL